MIIRKGVIDAHIVISLSSDGTKGECDSNVVLTRDILLYIYNNMIYNRIKTLRIDRGLSRRELADAVAVNFQTIGYLERGDYNPSLELAFKLAGFFEVPLEAAFSPTPFNSLAEDLRSARAAE
jgi:putative transcriptional regulator